MKTPLRACAAATLLVACADGDPVTRANDADQTARESAAASVQVWAEDSATTIFRQSITTHFEAPFMPLLVGERRALLIDTGTGDAAIRAAVDRALAGRELELVVAHSHAHGDHVGGDRQFAGRARTSIVGHGPAAVARAFDLVDGAGAIDLGGRVVDVLAIPGHEASHVAFYDRNTSTLYSGDTLYPGRLYVRDWAAYRASVARLVRFVDDGHPVRQILGAHIELAADGAEYAAGAPTHPDERALGLGEADLRDLLTTLEGLGATPARTRRPNYVIVPL